MTTIHHFNCGYLHKPPNPRAICHCLLLRDVRGLAVVDTGIGVRDVRHPEERYTPEMIESAGFQFDEANTFVYHIANAGYYPRDVRHIILTHGDPDHTGGMTDLPYARVHLSLEEIENMRTLKPRYMILHFHHHPYWKPYPKSDRLWFGLEARPLELGFESEVLLIPLFGHTMGHCGVAIQQGERWVLHVGDAYYLREELTTDDHPVSALAAQRADDDALRRASIEQLRRLLRDHGDQIELFGYHDETEFPADSPPLPPPVRVKREPNLASATGENSVVVTQVSPPSGRQASRTMADQASADPADVASSTAADAGSVSSTETGPADATEAPSA